MSTENTQADVSPSGISAESTSSNQGSTGISEVTSSAPSLDGLKKLAKEGPSDSSSLKPVEQSLNPDAEKTAAPDIPVYQPNYKYKAALQEKEVDEFWRPLIKDKDSEKKVIEALQKLDGFDAVKGSREELSKQFDSLNNDYSEQTAHISRLANAIQRKDLSSVFRQLGVTNQDIYQWTHSQLQMMDLPPEQRRAFEEAENAKAQQFEWEEKMTTMQRMYETQAVQARTMQLDFVLSRAEAQNTAQAWDSLNGEGSFRDLVIQEAQNAYYQTGADLTAEQAVQRVMQKFGKVMPANQQVAAPQMPGQQAVTPVMPQAKPIIPNINGKGTAPIKKVPKSLADLKKLAKEMNI